jgi:hypothetical protein
MQANSKGLIFFGACAVVAVAVVVIEEWPTIKETYYEVRARRRQRRMAVNPHQHHHHISIEEEEHSMTTSGIREPLPPQEMIMRSRTVSFLGYYGC